MPGTISVKLMGRKWKITFLEERPEWWESGDAAEIDLGNRVIYVLDTAPSDVKALALLHEINHIPLNAKKGRDLTPFLQEEIATAQSKLHMAIWPIIKKLACSC